MGRALRTGTLFLFLRRCHVTLIRPHVLVLKENTLGKDDPLVRQVGGIPIPEAALLSWVMLTRFGCYNISKLRKAYIMGKTHFDESKAGFTPILAMEEASRCLLCLDAPCSKMCPAGTDPAKFIRSLRFKNVKGAARTIRTNNPLGAVCARVCPTEHYCQAGCSRSGIDRPIDIGRLQRYITDQEDLFNLRVYERKKPNGKRVSIVGSGPAGLTASAYLALEGYEVSLFDKAPKAGGYLRYGIPEYRLPEAILDKEIRRIFSLGVSFFPNTEISDLEPLKKEYDAVLVADGFSQGKMLPLFEHCSKAITAVEFMKKAKAGRIRMSKHVLIIGGGDVAMDVATTCKKLGASQVTDVVYETFPEFKASQAELSLAREENVSIYDGFVPVSLKRGGVVGFDHRYENIHIDVKADLIVLAIGQMRSSEALGKPEDQGNLFYAGDIVEGDKTVVHAVKTGKLAAMRIIAHLGGK